MAKIEIKDLIKKVMAKDSVFMQAISEIAAQKPSISDLFKGTFKDKLCVMIKGFSTFAVVFLQKYEQTNGVTEDELIDALTEHFDEMVKLPWYAEYLDGPLFHFLITYGMKYVKDASASPITASYTQAMDSAPIV